MPTLKAKIPKQVRIRNALRLVSRVERVETVIAGDLGRWLRSEEWRRPIGADEAELSAWRENDAYEYEFDRREVKRIRRKAQRAYDSGQRDAVTLRDLEMTVESYRRRRDTWALETAKKLTDICE